MTNEQLLRQFVSQYRAGAQGAEMDYKSAQSLALAIEELLPHKILPPNPSPASEGKMYVQVEADGRCSVYKGMGYLKGPFDTKTAAWNWMDRNKAFFDGG